MILSYPSFAFESFTRAIFRKAELGFLGVWILTCVQTPLFWGHLSKTGALDFTLIGFRPFRISWLIVGI